MTQNNTNTDYYKFLGSKLKSARINKNLSIDEVCCELHISESSLRNWENGRIIKITNLCRLCNLYGLTLQEIENEYTK